MMETTKFQDTLRSLIALINSQSGLHMYAKVAETNELPLFEFWFHELGYREGPVFKLYPEGLHRHVIEVILGEYSAPIIRQIKKASSEQLSNARALLKLTEMRGFSAELDCIADGLPALTEGKSVLRLSKHQIKHHLSEKSFAQTASEGMSQLVLTMAELIGFEEQLGVEAGEKVENEMEGAVSLVTIKKRERSLRNRMLCLGFHGERCHICGFESQAFYGPGREVIEVHHIQPLSSLSAPRPFDPLTDLIPLCPNCHRAIHSGQTTPLTPEELRNMVRSNVRDS